MARADFKIALGPGGEILNVPENEELLEEIRRTPPLPPADLFKLGVYYRGYETNEPLGNHLELVALINLVSDSEAQKGTLQVLVRTAAAGRSTATAAAWSEWWDDFTDCGTDESNEARGGSCFSVRFIPFSNTNLGLLIETPYSRSHHHKRRNFVIGIAPDPASLPLAIK